LAGGNCSDVIFRDGIVSAGSIVDQAAGAGDDVLMGSILADEHIFPSTEFPNGPFNGAWDGTDTLDGGLGTDWLIDVADARGLLNNGDLNNFQDGEVVISTFNDDTIGRLTDPPNRAMIFGTFDLVADDGSSMCGGLIDCVEQYNSGLGAFLQRLVGINPPSSQTKGRGAKPTPVSTNVLVEVPHPLFLNETLVSLLETTRADLAAVFRNGVWYFDFDAEGGTGEDTPSFGAPGDVPVLGDWDTDGTDEMAVFRGGLWLRDLDDNGGQAEDAITFGIPGDVPVAGDWDGDGTDELAVFRNGVWFLDLDDAGGVAEEVRVFGIPDDVPVAGDWDGDGTDELAVFRGGVWYFDLDDAGGPAEKAAAFGIPGDVPVPGDWDGDGTDQMAVFRNGLWFFDLDGAGGAAERVVAYGIPGDVPVAGDWARRIVALEPAGPAMALASNSTATALPIATLSSTTTTQAVSNESVAPAAQTALQPAAGPHHLSAPTAGPQLEQSAETSVVDHALLAVLDEINADPLGGGLL
jgi:hypothetical protein